MWLPVVNLATADALRDNASHFVVYDRFSVATCSDMECSSRQKTTMFCVMSEHKDSLADEQLASRQRQN